MLVLLSKLKKEPLPCAAGKLVSIGATAGAIKGRKAKVVGDAAEEQQNNAQ